MGAVTDLYKNKNLPCYVTDLWYNFFKPALLWALPYGVKKKIKNKTCLAVNAVTDIRPTVWLAMGAVTQKSDNCYYRVSVTYTLQAWSYVQKDKWNWQTSEK